MGPPGAPPVAAWEARELSGAQLTLLAPGTVVHARERWGDRLRCEHGWVDCATGTPSGPALRPYQLDPAALAEERAVSDAFKRFDVDRDGKLSPTEV